MKNNTHEKKKGDQTSFDADCLSWEFHPEFALPAAPSMLLALT
jgi:hypothetical protein